MAALGTLIFTVLVPGTVVILIPSLLHSGDLRPFTMEIGAFRFVGLLPILLGLLTYLACAWNFLVVGRGTPSPLDPPKELVVKGPYRLVRNPMYAGVTLLLLGEAILFESATLLVYALLVLAAFHLFVVYYEEPTLKRKFGKSYEVYRNSVPRWVPGVKSFLSVLLGLLLTACAAQTETPAFVVVTNTLPPTQAAVLPTDAPSPSTPTRTPVPATDTPASAPSPTPKPPCANDLEFVGDVTVPDGAQYLPSQALVKKWNVRNSGTCDWGPDYRLVLVSGNALGARTEIALYPARAGVPAILEIPMAAPLEPGQYTGRWQARDPQGNLFGAVIFIKIEVVPLPVTDTPTP